MNYTIPFVGNDYYCESRSGPAYSGYDLYPNDSLLGWSGLSWM